MNELSSLVTTPWLRYIQSRTTQTQLRLFCFHFAGGSASAFRTWINAFPANIQVYPVQLPGRENRIKEPSFIRLSDLVQEIEQALHPFLIPPYAFFGHSMGTLISFELARSLRRAGRPLPIHLFVSAHRAPHLPDPLPPAFQLPHAAFLERLRMLGGTPEAVFENAELLAVLLPILRADFEVCDTYHFQDERVLDIPISAFGGLHDRQARYSELEAWGQHTSSSFQLRLYPGNHFFLQQNQKQVVQALVSDLSVLE